VSFVHPSRLRLTLTGPGYCRICCTRHYYYSISKRNHDLLFVSPEFLCSMLLKALLFTISKRNMIYCFFHQSLSYLY